MTASELIQKLEELIEEHGDAPIVLYNEKNQLFEHATEIKKSTPHGFPTVFHLNN